MPLKWPLPQSFNLCPTALRLQTLRAVTKPQHRSLTSAIQSNRKTPRSRLLTPFRSSYIHHPRLNALKKTARTIWRENPASVSLASLCILGGVLGLIYVNYFYKRYILDQYAAYPEDVAKHLRKALYFTSMDLQPERALKYYRLALETAVKMGMDPFSDELLGIRTQIAFMFEKAEQWPNATMVLEDVRGKTMEWLEQRDGEGKLLVDGGEQKVEQKEDDEGKEKEEERIKHRRKRRTEVLKKTVRVSAKLGDLYSDGREADPELAEERMVWAVTSLLKEQRRREVEGVKDGEGEWFESEEVGAALESLGTHYSSQRKNYLSAPLFLQALGLSGTKNCHAVVLMNNLAAALALQNSWPAPGQPAGSATQQLEDATTWAKKALELANEIRPPQRTEECDQGCAVATINLGDFAALGGDASKARDFYTDSRGLSKAIGFQEGVKRADKALASIDK